MIDRCFDTILYDIIRFWKYKKTRRMRQRLWIQRPESNWSTVYNERRNRTGSLSQFFSQSQRDASPRSNAEKNIIWCFIIIEYMSSLQYIWVYATVVERFGGRRIPPRGLQRDVGVYLDWPIGPSYMSPNAGRGGWGVSANEYSCAHRAQIYFGDLTPHLNYDYFSPPWLLRVVFCNFEWRNQCVFPFQVTSWIISFFMTFSYLYILSSSTIKHMLCNVSLQDETTLSN